MVFVIFFMLLGFNAVYLARCRDLVKRIYADFPELAVQVPMPTLTPHWHEMMLQLLLRPALTRDSRYHEVAAELVVLRVMVAISILGFVALVATMIAIGGAGAQ